MKKTKSLNELIVLAAEFFQDEKNKGVNEVYASEDGFIFIEENRVLVHCKTVPDLKYHTVTRTQAFQAIEDSENFMIDKDDQDENFVTTESEKEIELLKNQYLDLFGKQAHHNIGADKLKTLISEKIAETEGKNEGNSNQSQLPE